MAARIAVPLLILLTVLPVPGLAADPPPPITTRLEYVPVRGCPPESVLHAEFARRRGYDAFVEEAPLRLVATITRGKSAYVGFLEIFDSAGKPLWSRPTIPYADCQDVVVEMAGALAFRFDMRVSDPFVEPPPPPPPPPKPEPEPEPVPVPVPEPVPAAPSRPVTAPAPVAPKRSFRLVAGIDGVFTSFIAPSASAGVDLWAGVELLDRPFSFELDMRLTTSLVPAEVKLAYHQRRIPVHSSYISAVVAGCLRLPVSLCPLLEIGSMSFSKAGPLGKFLGPRRTVVAAGLRGVYERHLTQRLFVRGLVEIEVVPGPASPLTDALPGEVDQSVQSPRPLSLSLGVGFGGSLW